METYIILGKYTHQGIAKIKEGPARIEAARKAMDAAGGKMVAWYLTAGRYDFVAVAGFNNAIVGFFLWAADDGANGCHVIGDEDTLITGFFGE